MFLLIPEEILEWKDLRGNEKLVLAYVYHFTRKGKWVYASSDYLKKKLGIEDIDDVFDDLKEKRLIYITEHGWAVGNDILRRIRPKMEVKKWGRK